MKNGECSSSSREHVHIGLLGCALMSAEPQLATTIHPDLSELDPEKRDKLITRAEKFIEKLCTVKRTLKHGVETETSVQTGNG